MVNKFRAVDRAVQLPATYASCTRERWHFCCCWAGSCFFVCFFTEQSTAYNQQAVPSHQCVNQSSWDHGWLWANWEVTSSRLQMLQSRGRLPNWHAPPLLLHTEKEGQQTTAAAAAHVGNKPQGSSTLRVFFQPNSLHYSTLWPAEPDPSSFLSVMHAKTPFLFHFILRIGGWQTITRMQ